MLGPSADGAGGEHGVGVGWGDINIHIDINMNIDIHIIIDMNIQNYIIIYDLLSIPYWLFPQSEQCNTTQHKAHQRN